MAKFDEIKEAGDFYPTAQNTSKYSLLFLLSIIVVEGKQWCEIFEVGDIFVQY